MFGLAGFLQPTSFRLSIELQVGQALEVPPGEVTSVLQRLRSDARGAQRELLPLIYDELRRIAAGLERRERCGHTLQATALVHEAYLQLFGRDSLQLSEIEWSNRGQFLGVAARLMRRILVDHARRRGAIKRGGGTAPLVFNDELDASRALAPWVVEVDDALRALERFSPRSARVVELRFFGGLSLEEAAAVLGISRKTVQREWRRARAWLTVELAGAIRS